MYYLTNEELIMNDQFIDEMKNYFKNTFGQYDISLIRNVVYIKSIDGFEESTGLAIYQDWNSFFYSVNFGHCVMVPDQPYKPEQITEEEAIKLMIEMDEMLL